MPGCLKCGHGPAASVPPGNLLEMQNLRFHSTPVEVKIYIWAKSPGDVEAHYSMRSAAVIRIGFLFPFKPMVSLACWSLHELAWSRAGTCVVLCSLSHVTRPWVSLLCVDTPHVFDLCGEHRVCWASPFVVFLVCVQLLTTWTTLYMFSWG